MKKILILTILILVSVDSSFATCGFRPRTEENVRQRSSVVVPGDESNLKKFATISKKDAKKFAISQYQGKVKKAELVKEEDGTLVWKLEVKGENGQKELFIDPANGVFLGYGLTK